MELISWGISWDLLAPRFPRVCLERLLRQTLRGGDEVKGCPEESGGGHIPEGRWDTQEPRLVDGQLQALGKGSWWALRGSCHLPEGSYPVCTKMLQSLCPASLLDAPCQPLLWALVIPALPHWGYWLRASRLV